MLYKCLKGTWDLHVHATPSLFKRKMRSNDLVERCIENQMGGIVIKFHHGSSIEIAHALNSPNLSVYGGVVLNHFVGGLNPYAVDSAIALGAKIIWLPTMHAVADHTCRCELGKSTRKTKLKLDTAEYLNCLDQQGKLKTELIEILHLLDGSSTSLASGHISFNEIIAIIEYIESHNLNINFMLNHVLFWVPSLNHTQLRQCIRPWTFFEMAYLSISKAFGHTSAQKLANEMLMLPEANWIMSTDSGQEDNPIMPRCMNDFIEQMAKNALKAEQIKAFTQDNPRKYLNL